MKALVTYYTQTGNTGKVAKAIYEAISIEKVLIPIAELKDQGGYDIVFVGFPVHAHSVPAEAETFIKGLPKDQRVAFFSTHGSMRGGHLPKQAFEHALGVAAKNKVLGHFGCRGKVDPNIIEALINKPAHKAWAEEAQGAERHPDNHDLADAREFAQGIIAAL
ncbi:MAG TPA: hypothetical protein DCG53_05955 [Syntrophus sp. (in: bacteria)]|jgi:flavodoxin|nr:hypothetical protein [Syntrophus sp. (in: bacteria)]